MERPGTVLDMIEIASGREDEEDKWRPGQYLQK